MKTRTKIILWTSPILVIVLTILYHAIFYSGLNVPWKFMGNPSESISKIMGFNPNKLYVLTDSGEMYSLPYQYGSAPSPNLWVKDKNFKVELDPVYRSGYLPGAFTSPPPPFNVKQIYQFEGPIIEGSDLNKFALSDDGNLWFWYYGAGVFGGWDFY